MMLPASRSPRIIAIDDELVHLEGLANGLNQYGFACHQVHFPSGVESIEPCPHVRVIFADLHLDAGPASDVAKDFGIIGGFIEEKVKPSGPYFIVLWTMHPEEAGKLQKNLEERLKNVTKPFTTLSLKKSDHLDGNGNVKSTEKLLKAIELIVEMQPQIAALFNWEERVSEAAADTVSLIFSMVAGGEQAKEVGRLLARLAVEAAGESHVEQDRFHAVNEALLPILSDNIASLRLLDSDNKTWQSAFSQTDIGKALSSMEAAKLNRRVHIASTVRNQGTERGAVIALPSAFFNTFKQTFSLTQEDAAEKQFCCREFAKDADKFRWVLVQSQAACDYAQKQPGPLPYYLGLELPERSSKREKPPAALWSSPPFESEGTIRLLHVSARFPVSLSPAKAKKEIPLYRLREQLLNDLIYQIHGYGARPGMLSFRVVKSSNNSQANKIMGKRK